LADEIVRIITCATWRWPSLWHNLQELDRTDD
jgi:hypothetical protein